MEDLTVNPYAVFLRIFEFLELLDIETSFAMTKRAALFAHLALNRLSLRSRVIAPLRRTSKIAPELLLGRVYGNRFEKLAGGRKKGSEDPNSHYRKGKAGDWVNHFTPDHLSYFERNYGGILERMGYASDAESSPIPMNGSVEALST